MQSKSDKFKVLTVGIGAACAGRISLAGRIVTDVINGKEGLIVVVGDDLNPELIKAQQKNMRPLMDETFLIENFSPPPTLLFESILPAKSKHHNSKTISDAKRLKKRKHQRQARKLNRKK